MQRRIAHVCDCGPALTNGVVTAVYWLSRAQSGLGVKVFIYRVGDRRSDDELAPGIIRRTFPKSSVFGHSRDLCMWVKVNEDCIDIVHLHSVFIPLNFSLSRVCKKNGLPYVVTPHGGYDAHIFKRAYIKKMVYYKLFEKHIIHDAAGIHCVASEETKNIYKLGFRGAMCIAANLFDEERLLTKERIPANSKPRIIYLGRFDILHKGLDRLLNIWSLIETKLPDFELHFYGNGPDYNKLVILAKTKGLERIHFHAPVYGEEKISLLSESILYLQCSRWEVFGVSIVEAMAAGAAVAVSTGCFIGDTVLQAQCGIVFPDDDKLAAKSLIDLLGTRDRLIAMGVNGRNYVKRNFSPQVIGRQLLEFYDLIVGDNPSERH
jgi:glycosyltransferase involved in cell wall biosynthesis